MGKSIKKISFIALVFFCFNSCKSGKIEKFFAGDTFPDQVVKGFTMTKYDIKSHKWDFYAVRGDVYEKKKKINARSIKMSFYEAEKMSSVISADNAILHTGTGDISASGNVIIFSLLRDTTIFTDSINYFEKSGRVTSDTFVRQEKPDMTVTGVGLDANTDLSDITILSDVKVVKK
ncbi:MAG: LPS export ABC transporter periplasmic protein LptC [Elusimicrobia bacterium]|nr:LPS export ABC transporter periplasmic protein LptC [Elusimicrobiota bacterium]